MILLAAILLTLAAKRRSPSVRPNGDRQAKRRLPGETAIADCRAKRRSPSVRPNGDRQAKCRLPGETAIADCRAKRQSPTARPNAGTSGERQVMSPYGLHSIQHCRHVLAVSSWPLAGPTLTLCFVYHTILVQGPVHKQSQVNYNELELKSQVNSGSQTRLQVN